PRGGPRSTSGRTRRRRFGMQQRLRQPRARRRPRPRRQASGIREARHSARHRLGRRRLPPAPLAQLPAGNVPLGDGVIRRLFRRPPADVDPGTWQAVRDAVPWVAALDEARATRLRLLAARFLRDKAITPLGGLELDDTARTALAALCCLPLLEFGAEGLHGWSQLLVYPDAFRVDRSHVDAAGVMHEWEDELAGEAWEHGPLVLSWADVRADLESPRD